MTVFSRIFAHNDPNGIHTRVRVVVDVATSNIHADACVRNLPELLVITAVFRNAVSLLRRGRDLAPRSSPMARRRNSFDAPLSDFVP